MDRVDLFDRLKLDNQLTINQQVQSKPLVEFDILVMNGNRFLPLNQYPSLFKCLRQNSFINGFQQSRPQVSMQLQRLIDHY